MPLHFETQFMRIPESILQNDIPAINASSHLNLNSLPTELLLQISSNLTPFDRASLALTCHSFANFTSTFSLLTFTFHLPRHSFPDAQELLTYEDALTNFLLRLGRDWSKPNKKHSSSSSSSEPSSNPHDDADDDGEQGLRFCPSCAKFLPLSTKYWHAKALEHMVRAGGVEGGRWRRACQHFGGTYPLEAWIEKWCHYDHQELQQLQQQQQQHHHQQKVMTKASCCPRCKVMASSG